MRLHRHLVYIDVTSHCDMACDFCMYRKSRGGEAKHLTLSERALANMAGIINHPAVDQVVVSGEGEPFSNLSTVRTICKLSAGCRRITFVTNGNWIAADTNRLFELHDMAASKDDSYCVRVSLDSYHLKQVGIEAYATITAAFCANQMPCLSMAFRSLLEEKELTRGTVREMMQLIGRRCEIVEVSSLEDRVKIGHVTLPIAYKNMVWPDISAGARPVPMEEYIKCLEQHYARPFTFGYLGAPSGVKGLDITVKPDGGVFLYGIELCEWGNVHESTVAVEELVSRVVADRLVVALYTIPFSRVLSRLEEHAGLKRLIRQVNNPFWLLKAAHPEYAPVVREAIGL